MHALYSRPSVPIGPTVVIVAGCLTAMIVFGVRASFGLFLDPMTTSLGMGRDVFALAIAVQNLLWGLGQPFAGMIADRYGSGRVLAAGGVLYGGGILMMAGATAPLSLHLSAGLMVGFGLATASFAIVLAAMSRMVPPEKQSWALGLGTAAGSFGQFVIVPLGGAFIAAYGWQTALVLVACIAFLVVPLATALRGRGDQVSPAGVGPQPSMRATLGEAARHSGYRYLVVGFFVCGFHVTFIQVHLPPYLADAGLGVGVAAWALGLLGLVNVLGCYLAGVLGGRGSKKNLLALIYLARSIVITIFLLVPISTASVLAFTAAMGMLWLSTVPLTSGLVAQIFGLRFMPVLFGFVFFSHQVGAFLGVWLGGVAYRMTGSYDAIWWIAVALGLVAALVHVPIDERRVPSLAAAR